MSVAVEPPVPHVGTPPPWADVYEELAGPLISLGRQRYRLSAEDCEDALQLAAQDCSKVYSVRNPHGYLTAVYLRNCRHLLTARSGRAETAIPEGWEPSYDPTAAIDRSIAFRRAMGSLPARCREVINAWALADQNAQETARQLSLSKRTIYARIERCVKRLLNALS